MIVKLLTEHHLASEARPSLRMSKCHIVGNHVYWLVLSLAQLLKMRSHKMRSHIKFIKGSLLQPFYSYTPTN